ncbi:hypothetical protein PHYSODRAFT_457156, partial [Phytophthora sojae]
FASVYTFVVIYRVMVPTSKPIMNYNNQGVWYMSKWGGGSRSSRRCVPCVLGETLLGGLFPDTFSTTNRIVVMAL